MPHCKTSACNAGALRAIDNREATAELRLSPAAAMEAQRILDAAARRLLRARMDRNPLSPTTRRNVHTLDHGADERPLLLAA